MCSSYMGSVYTYVRASKTGSETEMETPNLALTDIVCEKNTILLKEVQNNSTTSLAVWQNESTTSHAEAQNESTASLARGHSESTTSHAGGHNESTMSHAGGHKESTTSLGGGHNEGTTSHTGRQNESTIPLQGVQNESNTSQKVMQSENINLQEVVHKESTSLGEEQIRRIKSLEDVQSASTTSLTGVQNESITSLGDEQTNVVMRREAGVDSLGSVCEKMTGAEMLHLKSVGEVISLAAVQPIETQSCGEQFTLFLQQQKKSHHSPSKRGSEELAAKDLHNIDQCQSTSESDHSQKHDSAHQTSPELVKEIKVRDCEFYEVTYAKGQENKGSALQAETYVPTNTSYQYTNTVRQTSGLMAVKSHSPSKTHNFAPRNISVSNSKIGTECADQKDNGIQSVKRSTLCQRNGDWPPVRWRLSDVVSQAWTRCRIIQTDIDYLTTSCASLAHDLRDIRKRVNAFALRPTSVSESPCSHFSCPISSPHSGPCDCSHFQKGNRESVQNSNKCGYLAAESASLNSEPLESNASATRYEGMLDTISLVEKSNPEIPLEGKKSIGVAVPHNYFDGRQDPLRDRFHERIYSSEQMDIRELSSQSNNVPAQTVAPEPEVFLPNSQGLVTITKLSHMLASPKLNTQKETSASLEQKMRKYTLANRKSRVDVAPCTLSQKKIVHFEDKSIMNGSDCASVTTNSREMVIENSPFKSTATAQIEKSPTLICPVSFQSKSEILISDPTSRRLPQKWKKPTNPFLSCKAQDTYPVIQKCKSALRCPRNARVNRTDAYYNQKSRHSHKHLENKSSIDKCYKNIDNSGTQNVYTQMKSPSKNFESYSKLVHGEYSSIVFKQASRKRLNLIQASDLNSRCHIKTIK